MPKSFADKESQIQYFLMVCKMRGMTVREIHSEIISTLKIDISVNSLYNRLQRYEEVNVKHFHELKRTNNAYVSRIMELGNHFSYYRKMILSILHDPKNKQSINSVLLFKAIELLQKLDQTEFNMLETMPDMFSWGRFNHIRGKDFLFDSDKHNGLDEKSIDEYVLSMEQIPIPSDLENYSQENNIKDNIDKKT